MSKLQNTSYNTLTQLIYNLKHNMQHKSKIKNMLYSTLINVNPWTQHLIQHTSPTTVCQHGFTHHVFLPCNIVISTVWSDSMLGHE